MPATPPFVNTVARATGLAPHVVQAWVQAEGGPAGNPLNIGPGRNYGSSAAAAQAVAHLINTSSYYSGIRRAISTGNPAAEVAAIKQSPWDAGHYSNGVLDRTFAAAGGGRVPASFPGAVPAQAPQAGLPGSDALAAILTLNNQMQGLNVPVPAPIASAPPTSPAAPQAQAAVAPSAGTTFNSNPSGYRFLQTESGVDLSKVDPKLLAAANALGQHLNKPLTVLSGYRDYTKQAALYQRYVNSGYNPAYIAARPGTSNHNKGEALDLTLGGVAISKALAAALLARFGLHNPVAGDFPHTTLSGVSG